MHECNDICVYDDLLFFIHETKDICPTLYDETTSLIGLNLWLSCCFESLHTTHADCLSSRQKSLSFSLCKLQISSDPDERLSFLSFRNDSHKFFNARLIGGWAFEDLLLQTGHSWVFLVLQNCWRHSLQTLWLHDKRTGVLKISQHTGQESSSTDNEAIFTVWAPAIETLLSLSGWLAKMNNHENHKICCQSRNKLLLFLFVVHWWLILCCFCQREENQFDRKEK